MSAEVQFQLVEELLTKKQLASRTKFSLRTIDRKIAEGAFPKGLKLGGAVRWRKAEIDQWIAGGCQRVSA